MRVAALYDIHANAVALLMRTSLLDPAEPLAIAETLERQAQEA